MFRARRFIFCLALFRAWGELANGLYSFNGCVITNKAANMLFYALVINSVRQICEIIF